MLLDENISLPGVISHTNASPGFIHYYNPNDAIFEEQLFVQVEGALGLIT